MLDHVTHQLKSASFEVYLNLNRNGYNVQTDLPIIYDSGEQHGPLFAVGDVLKVLSSRMRLDNAHRDQRIVRDPASRQKDDRDLGLGYLSSSNSGMTEYVLIATCDMPFVGRAGYEKLWEISMSHPNQIVHYEGNPFPGIYPLNILDAIQSTIQSGRRSMKALLDFVGAVTLQPKDVSMLRNINFVDDALKIEDAPGFQLARRCCN